MRVIRVTPAPVNTSSRGFLHLWSFFMQYVSTIQRLVEQGKQRRPELASRIEKAALIALFRRVEPHEDGAYLVESDTTPGKFYRVNGACECPDYAKAPDSWCKHRIALGLLHKCARKEQERRFADDRVAIALAEASRGVQHEVATPGIQADPTPSTTVSETGRWAQLLQEAVTRPGTVSAAYSAFHSYSIGNQLLAFSQCRERGLPPGPLATFGRWKDLGRNVRKGEKALVLCQPFLYSRKREEGEDEEWEERVRFAFRKGWFVLAQTDGKPYTPEPVPGWNRAWAISALGLAEVPFEHLNGNVLGYATTGRIAVSPLSPFPHKTTFHELAHSLLHQDREHTDGATLPRNLMEVEAEAVALLCLEALDLEGAEFARGYIQLWLRGDAIPEQSARRIFQAADRLLAAGRATRERTHAG